MPRSFLLASALLRDNWLIEATAAEALLPMVQALVDRAQLHQGEDAGAEEARELDPLFGCFAVQLTGDGTQTYKTFDEAPAGSTAILGIDGPILKDDFCDVGMNTKAEQIRTAYQHPNISSILLKLDTPGGQSNAPALAADAIREAQAAGVPVLAWVDHGVAASAGYWIAAACAEIWLSQPTDEVGSIGAYQRVRRASGSDNVLEVYAPQSKQKNLAQRKAAQGDNTLLETYLGDLVDQFIASVTADRGERLSADSDHFEGGMFMGKKAVTAGLADGICSFAAAVERVQQLAAEAPAPGSPSAGQAAPPSFSSDHLTPSLTVQYPLLCALLGLTAALTVDKEKGSYLQATDLDKLEASLAAQAAKDTELSTTKASLTTTTTELTDTKAKLTTAEGKLATYANVPAAERGNPKQNDDDRTPPEASADVDPQLAAVLAMKVELGIPNGPAK